MVKEGVRGKEAKVGPEEREKRRGKGRHVDEQISKAAKIRTVNEFASRPNFGGKERVFVSNQKLHLEKYCFQQKLGSGSGWALTSAGCFKPLLSQGSRGHPAPAVSSALPGATVPYREGAMRGPHCSPRSVTEEEGAAGPSLAEQLGTWASSAGLWGPAEPPPPCPASTPSPSSAERAIATPGPFPGGHQEIWSLVHAGHSTTFLGSL